MELAGDPPGAVPTSGADRYATRPARARVRRREGCELLRRGGLVGEERNAKLMLTVSATRHLRDPMSVIVGGDSSGGKSYLLKQVTKTLPEDFYYTLQSVSDKALAYIGEDTLVNRFLQIYELGGMGKEGEQGLEMAKQLLTEGSIERQIAESTGKGVRGRKVKTNGPTGLWTTTTKKTIHAELKNRALGFDIDESPEQTARIIKARPHRKKKAQGGRRRLRAVQGVAPVACCPTKRRGCPLRGCRSRPHRPHGRPDAPLR